jgi:hypothetical protein
MHDLYNLDSTANISEPPVPLGALNSVTPKAIKTALINEQTDKIRYDGDVFAFTLATQFAGKAYRYADELRAAGKKVIMGGIHVTVRPEEAMRHADAVKVVLESWQPLFELPANAGSIANSSELKPKFQPDFARIPAF